MNKLLKNFSTSKLLRDQPRDETTALALFAVLITSLLASYSIVTFGGGITLLVLFSSFAIIGVTLRPKYLLFTLFLVIPSFNPGVSGELWSWYSSSVLIVLIGSLLLLRATVQRRLSLWSKTFLTPFFLTWTLIVFISWMVSGIKGTPIVLGSALRTFFPYLQPFIIGYALFYLISSTEEIYKYLKILLVGGGIGCSLALINFMYSSFNPWREIALKFGLISVPPSKWAFKHLPRLQGAFLGPNNIGIFAAYISIVGIGLYLQKRKVSHQKTGILLVTLPIILVNILAYSRGAWLAFFSGLIVLLFLLRIRLKFIISIFVVLSCIILLSQIRPQFMFWLTRRIGQTSPHYLTERFEVWRYMLKNFTANPFFGAGLGVGRATGSIGHSIYLALLGETGVIGFIAYSLIFVSIIRKGLDIYKRKADSEEAFLAALSMAVMAVALGGGFVHNTVKQPLTSWVLGVPIGILLFLARYNSGTQKT